MFRRAAEFRHSTVVPVFLHLSTIPNSSSGGMHQACPSPGAHQTLSFSVKQLSTERQPKPGGENGLPWTGPQWGRWVAQIESHTWVDKIGLCAGLQNSLRSSSHRKGDPEDTVLRCANGRWCKYSLCASPWHKCNWPSETLQGAWDVMCCLNPVWRQGGQLQKSAATQWQIREWTQRH